MTELRVEHEILLCVARKSLDGQLKDRLRTLVQEETDWHYLLETASAHGLSPSLYAQINAHARDLVPPPILLQLKTQFVENSRNCLHLLRELLRTLALLSSNSIKAQAFKGPVLSALVYGDLALRRAGDLDILIERRDFAKAKEVLQSAGYQMEPQLTEIQQASHLDSHCEIQFFHEQQDCVVDLHWELSPKNFPFALKSQDVLNRSREISIGGQSLETFCHEDLLLYLCMHGAKHYWSRLEWIASIAELIRSAETIDWAATQRRASEAKAQVMLQLGLLLAHELFGVDLPLEAHLFPQNNQSLQKLADQIKESLAGTSARPPSQWEMFKLNLQFMDRRQDAVLALARSTLVPTIADWEAVNLPAPLYPLYYFFRPIRLAVKYGLSLKLS